MKRRDLKPGARFRYVVNPRHLYWVQVPGETVPDGCCASGPNPSSTDWELEVLVVEVDA